MIDLQEMDEAYFSFPRSYDMIKEDYEVVDGPNLRDVGEELQDSNCITR